MMGDDTTTQKSTSTQTGRTATAATPYSAAKPLLDKGFTGASNIYDATNKAAPWTTALSRGSTGMFNLANSTAQSDPMAGALGQFGKTFGADGYNTAQRIAMQPMEATARGDYLNLDNPDFQRLLNRSMEDASTEASMVASGMGRSGSDYHQDLVARTVGDMSADARLGQYNLERDRQTQAASSLFGMGQTGMGNTAAAGDVWSSLYGARAQPYQDLMTMGQMPQQNLQNLFGAANYGLPFANTVSTSTGSSNSGGSVTQPSNTFGKIAGAGLGLGSLLFG